MTKIMERTSDTAALDPNRAAFELFLRDRTARLVVTPVLLAVTATVYFVMLVTSKGAFDVDTLLRWGALYGPLVGAGEWWRLVSSAFVHAGFWHVSVNMLCLFYFGRLVERLVGPTVFIACYVLAAITGACASLLMHPAAVGVGASGAVFGIVGMLLSIAIGARRLSARQTIDETVAVFDAHVVPVSRTVMALNISTPTGATDSAASLPHSQPREDTPPFTHTMLRTVYASVAPFVMYNLALGLESGIDAAAHIGGLFGGFACGWLIARDVLVAKPSSIRMVLPLATVMLVAALIVGRLSGRNEIFFELARFTKLDRQMATELNAEVLQMQSGRRSGNDVATLVEARFLPPLLDARGRSEQLVDQLRRQLAGFERKDQYGRMARWRDLDPARNELALAIAWQQYLTDRETDCQLRVEALRQGTPDRMSEANRRDEAAAGRLRAALRRPH